MATEQLKAILALIIGAVLGVQMLSVAQQTYNDVSLLKNQNESRNVTNGTAITLGGAPYEARLTVTNKTTSGGNVSGLLASTSYTLSSATWTLTNNTWNNSELRFAYATTPPAYLNETPKTLTTTVLVLSAIVIIAIVAFGMIMLA